MFCELACKIVLKGIVFVLYHLQEIDPKAGGGCTMTIGQMVRSFLLKLEWYGTLFPRIPVPVQKDLEVKLRQKGLCDDHKRTAQEGWGEAEDFVRRTRGDRWVSLAKNWDSENLNPSTPIVSDGVLQSGSNL